MSFLKVVGKIGKGVLGVGAFAVDTVAGTNISGAVSKIGGSNQTAAVTSSTPPVQIQAVTQASQQSTWIDELKSLPGALVGALTGKSHVQLDVNTGVGGRQSDPTGTTGIPPIVKYGAIAGGAFLLINMLTKRRY